jgi:F420-dependent oxidoreductase-like protein
VKGIRIGISVADMGNEPGGLPALLEQFRRAEAAGFQTVWVPNIFGFDAMTLVALAARETRSIELGTAVVPTHSRHPFYMAQQALSTQSACGGRFVLGIGPSHRIVIENMLGLSYAGPARHVEEYVRVVKALVTEGKVGFQGERYRVNGGLAVTGGSPMPVLIGALGPRMRAVAGRDADGTITWMTGPRTLGESLVPEIQAAARAAGRPTPRVVAGLPIVLTDDPAGAREAASRIFALYGTLPSYRAMLDAEGAAQPGEIAIAGSEADVRRAIERLASTGVTDLNASIFPHGPDPQGAVQRTYALLADLARS